VSALVGLQPPRVALRPLGECGKERPQAVCEPSRGRFFFLLRRTFAGEKANIVYWRCEIGLNWIAKELLFPPSSVEKMVFFARNACAHAFLL